MVPLEQQLVVHRDDLADLVRRRWISLSGSSAGRAAPPGTPPATAPGGGRHAESARQAVQRLPAQQAEDRFRFPARREGPGSRLPSAEKGVALPPISSYNCPTAGATGLGPPQLVTRGEPLSVLGPMLLNRLGPIPLKIGN